MRKPIYISSPKGVDYIIQDLQKYLVENLDIIELVYGKAYKNQKRNGLYVPQVYDKQNEYIEVFTEDTLGSHVFFDIAETRSAQYNGENFMSYDISVIIRLIASADLERIYPLLKHRPTENFIVDIENVMFSYIDYHSNYAKWRFNRLIEGANNVYKNYSFDVSDKLVDMSPYYVVAFEYNVFYNSKILNGCV